MKYPIPELIDSRRLTGPNLFSDLPGAVIDLEVHPELIAKVIESWNRHARSLLITVKWIDERTFHRIHREGLSVVVTAPIDALYAATELNELAVKHCLAELRGLPLVPGEGSARLIEIIDGERNPPLLALRDAAVARRLPFLSDDNEVSIGYGVGCESWPVTMVPAPEDVQWSELGVVPVGLVTGTNGKSTTVRLATAIMTAAGKNVGSTSTDSIQVGDHKLQEGDYSGPGGARELLRHSSTEVALLEVARGGMLRRGLGVTLADAAVITNVAADHLGEFGIHTLDELTEAKFIVRRALARGKSLVLNADDEQIQRFARTLHAQRIVWFSENSGHPIVEGHCMAGGTAFVVHEGAITLVDQQRRKLVAVDEIPVTLRGLAHHNVQNVLAAAALCHVLNAPLSAIASGLKAFRNDPITNPGRGNMFAGHGIKVVVDFAHNAHGLSAVAQMVAAIPARRRLVMIGQAGDRGDDLIRDLVGAAMLAKPDHMVICQLPGYERGRHPNDVPRLIRQTTLKLGLEKEQISHADNPLDGVHAALHWAERGDLLLLLVLTDRSACIRAVRQYLR